MADDRMKMCGCSGIRHCLLCETMAGSMKNTVQKNDDVMCSLDPTEVDCYHFCLASSGITYGKWCNCVCSAKQEVIKNGISNLKDDIEKARAGYEKPELVYHRKLIERGLGSVEFKSLDGDSNESPLILDTTDVIVVEDFVTEREESYLQSEIYKLPWRLSQSGRRKQDFGPQANFKRKKVKIGNFTGLPFFLKDVVSKMNSLKSLMDFSPVEVCHLEYCPTRGSSIDPHIDDTWLWGERLVTLNLLSSTVLTLSNDACSKVIVQVPLPRKSLLVLQGKARNVWKHSILRRDITSLRLALTFRELSAEFASGSQMDCGHDILEIASTFDGKPLGTIKAVNHEHYIRT